MQKVCIVCLAQNGFDVASILKKAFEGLNIPVEVITIPHFLLSALTADRLRSLKKLLKQKSSNSFVIHFTDTTELFLQEADFTVLYSAYKNWFNPKTMRTIPHLWTPVRLPAKLQDVIWKEKPPLRIGFMGRTHATSRLATFFSKSPTWIKERLLNGKHLRYASLIALLNQLGISIQNIAAFPRIEAMQILREESQRHNVARKVEIVEKTYFGGTEMEISDFRDHLARNTYIICARGSENYSFRLYETLNYGRVPVIVDTDMVLPKEVKWDRLSVGVSYRSLASLHDVILRDYESRSADEFLERQQLALSTMIDLQTMGWAKDLAIDIMEAASKSNKR